VSRWSLSLLNFIEIWKTLHLLSLKKQIRVTSKVLLPEVISWWPVSPVRPAQPAMIWENQDWALASTPLSLFWFELELHKKVNFSFLLEKHHGFSWKSHSTWWKTTTTVVAAILKIKPFAIHEFETPSDNLLGTYRVLQKYGTYGVHGGGAYRIPKTGWSWVSRYLIFMETLGVLLT